MKLNQNPSQRSNVQFLPRVHGTAGWVWRHTNYTLTLLRLRTTEALQFRKLFFPLLSRKSGQRKRLPACPFVTNRAGRLRLGSRLAMREEKRPCAFNVRSFSVIGTAMVSAPSSFNARRNFTVSFFTVIEEVNEEERSGIHGVGRNVAGVASGVYFYRLQARLSSSSVGGQAGG